MSVLALQQWLQKDKGFKHKHDNLPVHPIGVKDHQGYFSRNTEKPPAKTSPLESLPFEELTKRGFKLKRGAAGSFVLPDGTAIQDPNDPQIRGLGHMKILNTLGLRGTYPQKLRQVIKAGWIRVSDHANGYEVWELNRSTLSLLDRLINVFHPPGEFKNINIDEQSTGHHYSIPVEHLGYRKPLKELLQAAEKYGFRRGENKEAVVGALFQKWLQKDRGFKHEHDNLPSHPIRVKDHQKYFSQSATPIQSDVALPKGVLEIDTSKLSDDTEFGAAAYVENGQLVGTHVTSNPQAVIDVLNNNIDLDKTDARGKVGDLGTSGLYFSAAPQIWTGRAEGKWAFLDNLSTEKLGVLIDAVEDVVKQRAKTGYIADFELKYALRDLGHIRDGAYQPQLLAQFADQPYSVDLWKDSFLNPLGIKQVTPPQNIGVRVAGKFADISSFRGDRKALTDELKKHGFDGAFVRGDIADAPQVVVWNNSAVKKFGSWDTNAASITPEELGKKWGIPVEVHRGEESGYWAGDTAVTGDNTAPGKYFAARWVKGGGDDFKSSQEYPANVLTAAHEIAHGLFSRNSEQGHKALDKLMVLGVPQNVAFENLVDLGGLYLLDPEAITDKNLRTIIADWLGGEQITKLRKADVEMPDPYSPEIYEWVDLQLNGGLVIGGNPPRGAKNVGKGIELRLFNTLQDAVDNYLDTLTGKETEHEIIEGVAEVIRLWEETNLPAITTAFETLFKLGFQAGAVSGGKMGTNDRMAMKIIEQGKYQIGNRIKMFGDEAIKDFAKVIQDAYRPEGEFTLQSMVEKMQSVMPEERWRLERVVRTETSQVSNIGRLWAWSTDEFRYYNNYFWNSAPDDRRKPISKWRHEEGPYSWPEIVFLWFHQEEFRDGRWHADQYNQRCSISRSPIEEERRENRFVGKEIMYRKTADITFEV